MLGVMLEFGIGHKKDISGAGKHYSIAANADNPEALNHLARLYETGKGCEIAFKTAFDLYKKASGLGHHDATTNYAYMLEHGVGCTQDKKLAFETYKIAADAGYAKAQNALGGCYYRGSGCKRDYFLACGMFKKAVDQGYAHAQNNLGICFEEGHGVPHDMGQAKILYTLAAEKRHPGGCCNLGYVLLLEGRYLDAIEKLYIAKALGDVEAMFLLGHLYENGCSDKEGVILSQDLDMALRLFHEAGKLGNLKALLRFASILICGPARLIDIPRAVKALHIAAAGPQGPQSKESTNSLDNSKIDGSKGSADAQNMLGELCEIGMHDGFEGEPSIHKALEWYRLAIKKGHDRAMFNLGALYEKGLGVPKDLNKAIRFYHEVMNFNQSKKLGNSNAADRLQELKDLGMYSD